MTKRYKTVIGLEVHIHLKTNTKIFCRCINSFGGEPNSHICPVCTGQPGTLPVFNRQVLVQALKAALAFGCTINRESVFERKQYFYPDLPKNYQISQYAKPLAEHGYIDLESKKINITRVHLEEDAGKLVHSSSVSMIDYNRTGAPLLEIVSEPEIESPSEAGEYLRRVRQLIRYAGVSDCDMEKGSMRCDANISLRESDLDPFGTKIEIKNLNSFKAVEKALEYEVKRQSEMLNNSAALVQETRLWDEDNMSTRSMRTKEEADDYRYFPDPDLPVLIADKIIVDEVSADMPENPFERKNRFISELNLSEYDAKVLTQEKEIADYFESIISCFNEPDAAIIKKAANWLSGEFMSKLNSESIQIENSPVSYSDLAELILLISKGSISGKMGKDIFIDMWGKGLSPAEVIEKKGLSQISDDSEIENLCRKVIDSNKDIVDKYLSGKVGVLGALVGSVMRESHGQANPKLVNQKLIDLIKSGL